MTAEHIERWLQTWVSEALRLPPETVKRESSFIHLGLDSLVLLTLTGDLARLLGRDLPVTVIWENPTLAALALALAGDSPEIAERIPPQAPREHSGPLSHAQRRMWKSCRALPSQERYCLHLPFTLRGRLDKDALRRALDGLVRRHEILRTTFHERDGAPVQTVHPPTPAAFTERDLCGLAEAEQKAALRAPEVEAGAMKLEHGPLLHAHLLQLSETEHRLVLSLHHLLCDFHSARILYRELRELYASGADDRDGAPPGTAPQVAELASAEAMRWGKQGKLYPRRLAEWLEFWKDPPPRASPSALLRWWRSTQPPSEDCFRSAPIEASTMARLEAFGRREEATLYTVLLAAFAGALGRYAAQEQLLLGTYISARAPEAEQSLGLFVNLLPLRLDLRTAATFPEILRRVLDMNRKLAAWHEAPLDEFSAEMQARGQKPPAPEILFHVLQSSLGHLQLPGLEVEPSVLEKPPSMPYGIVLNLHKREHQFRATLSFDITRYRPDRMTLVFAGFLDLLQSVALEATP